MYQNRTPLPDITNQAISTSAPTLQWVGMEQIGLPLQVPLSDGTAVASSAMADVFVSLDTAAKGIHMSRLYLKLTEMLANQPLNAGTLNGLLDSLLASHLDISQSAMVQLTFDLPLKKKALLSDHYGYQSYPVVVRQQLQPDGLKTDLELTIPYSSTCPCSASLATQLNVAAIEEQFPGETLSRSELTQWLLSQDSVMATPHNQRSYAYLKLSLAQADWGFLDHRIFQLEEVIGTPVQTAVKRQDEQDFARLNGANLMFCEDAARRLKLFLQSLDNIQQYWFKIEHQESLHAHNAVVIDQG